MRDHLPPFLLAIVISALIAGAVFFWFPPKAQAQSFSCRNADTPAEQTICESGELRALDVRLNRAYLKALRDNTRMAPVIQNRQRRWLSARESCGRSLGCLRSIYRDRLSELQ